LPPHALKGQKHLAQGTTLGISAISLTPCRGKSIKNARIIKMKTREEYIALIASHAGELQNTFGITSLRLFGSVARNEHHEGSDVDVFVEMPPKFFLVVRLKAYLEELLDNPVDIIRKHQHLNPILLKEIERDGIEVIAER
jgi:predicted nucleotidyltransferase